MEAPADIHRCASGPAAAADGGAAAAPLRLFGSAAAKALPVAGITAFAHGFLGASIGGIVYMFAPPWLQLRELPFGAASILALATILGGFEVWRVADVRAPDLVRARILLVLFVCLIVLLTVASLAPALTPPSPQEWPSLPLAPRKTMFC